AGEAAAEAALRGSHTVKTEVELTQVDQAIASLTAPLRRPAGESPFRLQAEIQDALSQYAPIVRDGPGLEAGLEKIRDIQERAQTCGTGGSGTLVFNPGWHTASDIRSMLVNAEALLRSAIERKESRGAHARSDYPKTDEQLGRVTIVVQKTTDGMGGMGVRSEPI